MLARVTGGKSGIIEYLEDGMKSDRAFTRDELDQRVAIDGNSNVTRDIIKSMQQDERPQNYYHITLGFSEKEISEDKIRAVYEDYKNKLMSAYSSDEYNVYTEIHYPKIKSYDNARTGEVVERYPHVHIVIPKQNMVTGKDLNPFGRYENNVKYMESIQESVNYKFEISSSFDNQREIKINTIKSDIFDRYKGGDFKGVGSEVKKDILNRLSEKDVRTVDDFKKLIAEYGEVGLAHSRSGDYFKVKPEGSSKFIRLKDPCFKKEFIEDRVLLRPKPTQKSVDKYVADWVGRKSHEVKHIWPAGQKIRKEYDSLTHNQKLEYLNRKVKDYGRRHFQSSGRTRSNKLGIEQPRVQRFTQIPNGLSNMPPRGLARAENRRVNEGEGLLHGDENDNLVSRRAGRDHELRRSDLGNGSRGATASDGGRLRDAKLRGIPRDTVAKKGKTLAESYLLDHKERRRVKQEYAQYKSIVRRMKAKDMLEHFSKTHGLIKSNYRVESAMKGEGERIRIGNRSFTLNDFCTQHMKLSWDETKNVLNDIQKRKLVDIEEQRAVNSITFASNYVTQGRLTKGKVARLDESLRVFQFLKIKELRSEKMALKDLEKHRAKVPFVANKIESADISLKVIADNVKRQQAIAEQVTSRMNNLVASKDVQNSRVNYHDQTASNARKPVFSDYGESLVMQDKKPSNEHVGMAMKLASEKFGVVEIKGTKEFKQQAIDAAVTNDLKIIFANKQMQKRFEEQKKAYQASISDKNTLERSDTAPTQSEAKDKSLDKAENIKTEGIESQAANGAKETKEARDLPTVVEHGEAPYKHDKENSSSYYVELSDGKTHWGVGLKDAVEKNNIKVGDRIEEIRQTDSKPVTVSVKQKDENGDVVGFKDVNTHRNEWVITKDKTREDDQLSKAEKSFESRVQTVEKEFIASVESKANDQEKVFRTAYKFSEEHQKMGVTINGKSPNEIPKETLEKIVKNDSFLKAYGVDKVRSGALDMKESKGIQPVANSYNDSGAKITETQNKSQQQTKKATQ